jgi:hypothetical protein
MPLYEHLARFFRANRSFCVGLFLAGQFSPGDFVAAGTNL